MSSPEIPPESTPSPDEEASPPLLLPPTSLPLPPTAVIASSPLLPPPAPPLSPSPATPASSPSLPSLPSFPPKSPPLLSPPKPPASSTPPPAPALSIPPPSPALSSSPPAPALSSSPAPALSTPLPSHPTPASSKTPPASPVNPTKPNPPPSSSTPATATPKSPAPTPPARIRRRPSSARSPSSSSSSSSSRSTTPPGSKPLPTTISSAPPPVASPTSQPFTGGSSPDDMPLTAEKPAPQPSVPLTVGGGSRPAMAVLPAGANGGSNIQAATAGRGGGTPTAGVSTGIIAGLCVGGVVLVALLVFGILLVFCRRRKGDRFDDCGAFACNSKLDSQGKLSLPTYTKGNTSFPDTQIIGGSLGSANSASGMALVSVPLAVPSSGTFTYEELVSATNGFSESNLLGQGGFGYVHKGVLPNGKEVAVKQLKMGGQQGEREFRAEVETISQVHHKHLVSLVGYCIAGAERLLVYEFVPNQTMDFHLHGKDQPVMEWSTRLRIAIGSAKGLAYLHEDCNPTIIHRDIKAANILLDFNCEVKVSDFGLAKIFSNTNSSITHITTRVVGTFGYLAPEYASSGKVTDKSDVYSYGVMLLELITGRPPITTSESAMNGSLVNWARPLLPKAIEEGNFDTLVDPRLQNSYNADEMANMVACAAACVRLSAWRRPRMSQVIRALEGDLSPSDLDDGVRPGHSSMHFPYESLDFDAQKYMEDMRKLRMALSSNSNEGASANGTRYSDNTSEYGLQPSISSADSHELNTRSLRLGRD